MFNLKYNSSQILSFVILVICLIAVSDNVDFHGGVAVKQKLQN